MQNNLMDETQQLTDNLIAWLLDGDPAIRWQTQRDLLDAPDETWQSEQRRTAEQGWGAQLLALQEADGRWGGGIYSPKWISTTYTLLTLLDIGIPRDNPASKRAAELVLDEMYGRQRDAAFMHKLANGDRCIVGMDLAIAAYCDLRDERMDALVENLLAEVMPDGAWNCRYGRDPKVHHSSFHTTLNVLEGLRTWLETTPGHPLRDDVLLAEKRALEFILEHRLYKSDKSGEIINYRFTLLSYPHRWYYNLLRGLAYFARANAPYDERLEDALEVLREQRRPDGTWPVQHKYPGRIFFDMEKTGKPSRWNTLRALRVLKWWEGIT